MSTISSHDTSRRPHAPGFANSAVVNSKFTNHKTFRIVALLFVTLLAIQGIALWLLGPHRAGAGVASSMLVLHCVLAIGCALAAFRRARGIARVFWLLFAGVLFVILIPTFVVAFEIVFKHLLMRESTLDLLFALYGAPVLMMLLLPRSLPRGRMSTELFLDLFQVSIVVGLFYSTFFFFPVRSMLPADAIVHDITISDAQTFLLFVAAAGSLLFARSSEFRNLLSRLSLFLAVCTVITFIGDWIYVRFPTERAWFQLGWALPVCAGGLIALSWSPSPGTEKAPERTHFLSFLVSNLVLVVLLSTVNLLVGRFEQAHGELITLIAVGVSMLALALRLALTQYHQHQEILQRKAAQHQLTASHEKIGRLLDAARRQTAEITQISELAGLLQACTSTPEVFRLIPEHLCHLFPGSSGCLAIFNPSKNRVESGAEWGVAPRDQSFAPTDCWALRRGSMHVHPGGKSGARCAHLLDDAASACIPLIANGESVGILVVQESELSSPIADIHDAGARADMNARRLQLAANVAEHVAVTMANLSLRESLRVQAIRDPLTQLYNRRYMQEFLDRELHSARRKRRPLAVMMLDVDHFKRYNDTFGHAAGDQALALVGQMLLRSIRAEDVACRYGGEEFSLILPECSLRQAVIRAEQIRNRIEHYHPEPGQPETHPLTVSVGVAAFDETTDRVDLLLKFADEALYEAKRTGRNRVLSASVANPLAKSTLADSTPVTVEPV